MKPKTEKRNWIAIQQIFVLVLLSFGTLQPQCLAADGSDQPPQAPTASQSETVAPTSGKRIEILFGGSLCPVCLAVFEKRLAATAGVLSAKVEAFKESKPTGHPPKRAHAIIEFAPEKINQSALVDMVKNNDFQFLKVVDL
ncbi:MAG TPA: hypothetical protein V6C97_30950 [Oculatellaceae cyanobacterium]